MKKILRPFSYFFFWNKFSPTWKRYFQAIVGVTLIILIPIAYYLHESATKAVAAWYDDNYGYRQIIAITNAGSALTNYPVTITLDTATLISAGKMQSDCDDIRITDINGKVLPFLLDTGASGCNTSTTNISTKVPSIPTSGASLYVYYGNPTAVNVQNGNQVFPEWDLTTFTKVDPNSRFSIDSSKQITVTSMSSNEDAYIYKTIASSSTGTLDADVVRSAGANKLTCTGVSTQIDDCFGATVGAYMYWPFGGFFKGFNTASDTNTSNITAITSDGATTYYMRIKYDGANATFYVYSNPARTTLLGSQSLSFSTSFTQLFAVSSYNDSSGASISEIIRNVHLKAYTATEPVVAAPASEEKSPAPVAYWKFDEGYGTTTKDSSSNGNTGTLTNGPTWQTEDQCISGKCLRFDGSDDFVLTSNPSSLQNSNGTIAAWIKTSNAGSSYRGIVVKQNAYGMFLKDNVFMLYDWTASADRSSGVNLGDGKWHYVVTTFQSGVTNGTILYVDGVAKFTTTITVNNQTQALVVGSGSSGGSQYFGGQIDEPKVYNYTRSAAQVLADYNSRSTNKGANGVLGASNNQPAALSNGLVGYWKMDESSWNNNCSATSVTDSSGNGNNGKSCPNSTGPTGGAAGKFGNGGSFDGSDDYVSIADNSSLNSTSAVTVSMWVKPGTQTSTGYKTLIQKGPNNNSGYLIRLNGSSTTAGTFNINLDGSYHTCDSTGTYASGNWYHLVATYDGSFCRVFINGKLDTASAATGALSLSGTVLLLGKRDNNDEYYTGTEDEVRVYNRALSPAEVSQLYNFAPGPVGYWRMDDHGGTSVVDSSGYGNTGSFSGGSPIWKPGQYGSALQFPGNSSPTYVSIPSATTLDGFKSMSACAWTYLTTTPTSDADQIMVKSTTAAGASPSDPYELYGLSVDTNKKIFWAVSTGSSSSRVSMTTTTAVALNKWNYICGTYDGATLKVFVNGVQDATTASTTLTVGANSQDVRIGGFAATGFPDGWDGKLDEAKIYNYARTQGQIIQDMNAGHPAPGSPVGTPLGYWKFDEGYGTTANNSGSQGSALNGTLTGMASPGTSTSGWTQSGRFGKALNFDGTNDWVDLGNPAALSPAGPLTVEAWVNFRSTFTGADWYVVVSKYWDGGGGTGRSYNMQFNKTTGKLSFEIYNSSDSQIGIVQSTTASWTGGQWYHLVGTWDGTATSQALKLYVNGVLNNSGSASSTAISTTATTHATIGSYGNQVSNPSYPFTFPGTIDEVKIYGQTLTAAQVLTDMNRGSSQVLGALSDTTSYATNSANQEYCVPGDTTSCAAPIGRWDFEEGQGTSVNDSSGNANTGTWNGTGATHWKPGKIGKSGNFDGSSDFVSIAGPASLTSFTTETWIKRAETSNNQGGIIDLTTLVIAMDTSKIDVIKPGVSNNYSTSTISDTNWHHVAVVATSGSVDIYIDGKKDANVTPSFAAGTAIDIGKRASGATQYFNGQIDQVRVFNYARTASQIAWDYNKGLPVGWWKMDECQGATANDSSGNGNAGTWNGTGSGTQTSVGTCTTSSTAWGNGVTGKINYSLNFDGTDDYILTANNVLNPSSTDFTASAWFKASSLSFGSGNYVALMSQQNGSGTGRDWLTIKNSSGSYILNSFIGGADTNGAISLSASTWYHAVVTKSGTSIKVYLNGILTGSGTQTAESATGATVIGANKGLASEFFPGQIDDTKVFNYALTPTQIKTLYNNGAVNFSPITGAP